MLKEWIDSYHPKTELDFLNAKREILQEVILAGLYRGNFFDQAVFYGGTALRVLYDLDRYSEDLDFCLLEKNPAFTIEPYLDHIKKEFELINLKVDIELKKKAHFSAVESAFLKDNSEWAFLKVNDAKNKTFPKLKIKLEVDRNPPLDFETEAKLLTRPYSYYINVMKKESLFAGKMHATLFRAWGTNVKGRDWYDLQWYISKGITLDLKHFQTRSTDSGNWPDQKPLTKSDLSQLYKTRVENLNIETAKTDILRFINDPEKVKIWSKTYFLDLFEHIKTR